MPSNKNKKQTGGDSAQPTESDDNKTVRPDPETVPEVTIVRGGKRQLTRADDDRVFYTTLRQPRSSGRPGSAKSGNRKNNKNNKGRPSQGGGNANAQFKSRPAKQSKRRPNTSPKNR